MRTKRTPWQKIRDAGKKGTGLRLTADECGQLWMDGAILMKASNDDEEQQHEQEASKGEG